MTSYLFRSAAAFLALLLSATSNAQEKRAIEFNVPTGIQYPVDETPSSATFHFTGERGLRVTIEARTKKDFVPRVLLWRDTGREGPILIAGSSPMADERSCWLDVALPETGPYQVEILNGSREVGPQLIGTFDIVLRKDSQLPTSRFGSFYLAHADRTHAWLADMSTLARSGDIARFKLTEILETPDKTGDGTKIHSTRSDYELNCVDRTFRKTKATMRLVGPGGKHRLQEAPLDWKAPLWEPLAQHGELWSLVCEPETAPFHLNWTQLEEAVDAYRAALDRRKEEGEDQPTPASLDEKDARTAIALGQTVTAVHAPRPSSTARVPRPTWHRDSYVLRVRKGDRIKVNVEGDFRPYLRLRRGSKTLVSTFGALNSGVAGPIGDNLEFSGDTEVLIEVSSFDQPGGRYTLTVRPAGEEVAAAPAAGYRKACDGGSVQACLALGILHVEGKGGAEKDQAKAAAAFERACAARSALGCFNLGLTLGSNPKPQLTKSTAAYVRACDLDVATGCLRAGLAYANKNDVPDFLAGPFAQWDDIKRAVELLEKACALEEAQGCYLAALVYTNNRRVFDPKVCEAKITTLFMRGCEGGYATACVGLGWNERERGLRRNALTSFDRAIQLAPQLSEAYAARAALQLSQGQTERAIADCNEASRLKPENDFYYLLRGAAHLYSGAPTKAYEQFEKAARLDPKSAYSQLWLEVAARRGGGASTLARAAKSLDLKAWPAPVVRFYLGETEAARAAEGRNQLCEANFFTAELLASRKQTQAARALYDKAAQECPVTFIENAAAGAALAFENPSEEAAELQAEADKLKTSQDRSAVIEFLEDNPEFLPQLSEVQERLIVEAVLREANRLETTTMSGTCGERELVKVIDDFEEYVLEPRYRTLRRLDSEADSDADSWSAEFKPLRDAVCRFNRAPYFKADHTKKLLAARCDGAVTAVNSLKIELGLHCGLGKEVNGVLLKSSNLERELDKALRQFADELAAERR